ncbi:MAG TPA: hypothetical protein VD970_05155 [Acetobacteraceae bacterium]|nr:hypothetical protein [Acetobacteraceae bacterium]
MALVPDYARRLCQETNVCMPAGLKTGAACDLALYHEAGAKGRGVLVVTTICSLSFKSGRSSSTGATLVWTQPEKTAFMSSMCSLVRQVWSDKHRIRTSSTVPAVTDVGMLFDLRVSENLSVFSHSHWNLEVVKTDAWKSSSVGGSGGNFLLNGSGDFDSGDINPALKAPGVTQRAAVHEFGHMMGLRDEYLDAKGRPEDNPHWTADIHSVMNSGEQVRDRHYTMFAYWVTKQFGTLARLARQSIEFKVNGTLAMADAKL